MLRDVSADPSQRGAGIDAGDIEPRRQRARRAAVIITDQRQGRRDVARFAQSHQCAGGEHLIQRMGKPAQECRRGPEKQAEDDNAAPAGAIGDESAEWAGGRVNPQENRREQTELRIGHRDVGPDRVAHRRDHQPIEIIQKRDDPKQSRPHTMRRRRGFASRRVRASASSSTFGVRPCARPAGNSVGNPAL